MSYNKKYFPIVVESEWGSDNEYISWQCYIKKFHTIYFCYNKRYQDSFQSCKTYSELTFPLHSKNHSVKFLPIPFFFEPDSMENSILVDF